MPKAMKKFNVFLQTDLGLALMAEQQTVLNRYLSSLAGYNLLQLSVQQGRRLVPDVQWVNIYNWDLHPSCIQFTRIQ